jgi:hypothetical protein
MSITTVTRAVGWINHLWLSVLADPDCRGTVGVRYMSHGWDSDPYWLFWFAERPGVYRLELNAAAPREGYDWVATFVVKYFPAKTETAFHGLSALEKLLRESEVFDTHPVGGGGGCPCHATDHEHAEDRFKDLEDGCGVPLASNFEAIPPDFFFAGHLSIAHSASAGAVITAKSQTTWRVEMTEDYNVSGGNGTVVTLVKKGSVDRDYPGLDITDFLYRRFITAWASGHDVPLATEEKWEGDGLLFRTDGLTLAAEPCGQIRRVILQTTIAFKPGVRLVPPADEDMEGTNRSPGMLRKEA